MKRSVKSLLDFSIGATDGDIGKVSEFYFDDRTWMIRYLVAETGNWLSGRKVLISPESLLTPDWEQQAFAVSLTKEEVKSSPDIDTNKPVSRQQEAELDKVFPRTGFLAGGLGPGGVETSGTLIPIENMFDTANKNEEDNDPHLRSTKQVTGYSIKALDGDIGVVEDLIIDDTKLRVDYLVVDTGNWFAGKKVIISPKWIKEISWETSEVVVNATVDQVRNAPEYDVSKYVDEVYESSLTNYYGRFIY
ncbi:PRC-barrel domain containing protein [Segetibacter sp. 3557_3]|uniref:PRC-barrel domain-containing protein n=1 Tax=Segetibacter sp. 3557_3 TaxID=2547429 RepID=UPI001058AC43|nr:PRC-barrel domain-containing protein [Segetibacter sp. 3557_3]TDH28525.1 PRC-barrel domain containing protein [Segetibacter sp. 3557_3]